MFQSQHDHHDHIQKSKKLLPSEDHYLIKTNVKVKKVSMETLFVVHRGSPTG